MSEPRRAPLSCRSRRALIAILSVSTVFLAGVGCLGRSPAVEHYLLGTPSSATSAANLSTPITPIASPSPDASGPAIGVGPVALPAYLERSKLARLETGGQVELDEFGRWLGGFEENFLRAISLGLARELGSVKVVTYPSSAPFPLDYRVRLHVDDLVLVAADNALRVRIRWALIREGSDAPAELFLLEQRVPVEGSSNLALVRAHESALSELASAIAREVRR